MRIWEEQKTQGSWGSGTLLKVIKTSQNSRNQSFSFSYYFWLMVEGSGSVHVKNGSGSGSGRPKNIRIRSGSTTLPQWLRNKLRKTSKKIRRRYFSLSPPPHTPSVAPSKSHFDFSIIDLFTDHHSLFGLQKHSDTQPVGPPPLSVSFSVGVSGKGQVRSCFCYLSLM